jgi:hypothetical protein
VPHAVAPPWTSPSARICRRYLGLMLVIEFGDRAASSGSYIRVVADPG